MSQLMNDNPQTTRNSNLHLVHLAPVRQGDEWPQSGVVTPEKQEREHP
jgi:hypothetical protein